MKVIACLTLLELDWSSVLAAAENLGASAIIHHTVPDLIKSAALVAPDVVVVDSRIPSPQLSRVLDSLGRSPTVLMASAGETGGAESAPHRPDASPSADSIADSRIYDFMAVSEPRPSIERTLRRALERSGLLQCAEAVFEDRTEPAPTVSRCSERAWELALRSLSRTLSAGFDTQELIQPFLDLVIELAGVARAAILMPAADGSCFRVCASRGLYNAMLRSYSHPRESGLVHWLVTEGRPLRRDDLEVRRTGASAEIYRSFNALQATACIPMAALGELIGVLAVGSRINGAPPSDDHVEMLFTIGSHIAVAVQNTVLHHEMSLQKAESESVLEHMTNGIAAIDANGRVTIFNRRAAEILRLRPEEVIGRDLRALPAPLGDYLYSALRLDEGGRYGSLSLSGSGVPVDVSTYPLRVSKDSGVVGSVLVVEDITERKALEESKRYADRQEVFSRLISQLAHEIKNPLVAVKTFADLFNGAFDDNEFVAFIRQTVVPEISRLDTVVGKLVDFVNHNTLDVRTCAVQDILGDVVRRMAPESESAHVELALSIDDDLPPVRADASLLCKALSYLLSFVMLSLSKTEKASVRIHASRASGPCGDVLIEFTSSRPWIKAEEIDRLFDPLFVRKDQLNLGLPVARKIVQEHRGDVRAAVTADGSVILCVTLRAPDAADVQLAE